MALVVASALTLAVWEANYLPIISFDVLLTFGALGVFAGLPAAVVLVVVARLVDGVSWRMLGRGWQVAAVLGTAVSVAIALPAIAADRLSVLDALRHRVGPFLFLAGLYLSTRPGRRTGLGHAAGFAVLAVVLSGALSLLAGARWSSMPRDVRPVPAMREAVHPGRILVIGIDGLGWETLERWLAAGGSPDYDWLAGERAVSTPLETIVPTASPRIWTTIATGRRPRDHGAISFTSHDVRGLEHPVPEIPAGEAAFLWTRLPRKLGWLRTRPIAGLDTRCPTFWEIVNAPNRLVDVVGWWCTWPAEEVRGRIVSDRFYFQPAADDPRPTGVTYPAGLATLMTDVRRRPVDIDPALLARFVKLEPAVLDTMLQRADGVEERPAAGPAWVGRELPRALAMDETSYAVAMRLLERSSETTLSVFYFRGVDLVGHAALHYSTLYDMDPAVCTDAERAAFGEVVSEYYAYTFERVRRLVEMAGDDAMVLIVSDHGFARTPSGTFDHDDAPPGVLIAHLPRGHAPVAPPRASVYDVTPTVLWLCGWPVAEDMPGTPWMGLFRDSVPTTDVASYGYRRPRPGGGERPDTAEELELLRNLGYIQ